MDTARQTLSKEERLSGKTAVSRLMSEGKWFRSEHFKICVIHNELEFNRILVSVPKRFFKRAVKRNLLKRRIRESYRTQKQSCGIQGADIMFFYNVPVILSFEEIRQEIGQILSMTLK